MLIAIVGAGYVGLVTAACLAKLGNVVRCVDIDAGRIERLARGELPIREPGLDELVAEGTAAGRLSFHSQTTAVHDTELVIVAVGTLTSEDEWTADIVQAAVLGLAGDPRAPRRLVIRSTLMPGTAVEIRRAALAVQPDIELGHNPEFTREASAVRDFLNPDRVVIGVDRPEEESGLAADLRRLYEPLGAPIVVTDLTSAETIKVASNVFLAGKIAFANELSRICAAAGADVYAVVDGMGLDRRIGRQFLTPGPGFGGSCFPSQARALPDLARQLGVSVDLMSAIWPSNVEQAAWFVEQTEAALGRPLEGARLALLGLTFKAGTDDLRESPALALARLLAARGARLSLYDPAGSETALGLLVADAPDAVACPDYLLACEGADAILCATEWPEFRELDWPAIAALTEGRLVVDTRRVIDAQRATAAGFRLLVMGVDRPVTGRQP